jgi:hypothetical protein
VCVLRGRRAGRRCSSGFALKGRGRGRAKKASDAQVRICERLGAFAPSLSSFVPAGGACRRRCPQIISLRSSVVPTLK